MTSDTPTSTFRIVRRGYEPTDVDRRLAQLHSQLGAQHQQVMELTARIHELEASAAFADATAEGPAAPPSFADLGTRVGQILTLAQEEAAQLQASAEAECDARLSAAETEAAQVRQEAEEYAEQRRTAADNEADRLVEQAHRRVDELNAEAERDAAARRAEADAVYEAQQARAAQAAADFETTLAERRDRVEGEFNAQFESTRAQLDAAQAHLEQTRNEAQRIRGDAELGAKRHIEDAQREASEIVGQARAHAERVSAETERELAAATQRRDSINAQLANVRQMLATLTNVSPAGLLALDDDALVPEASVGDDADLDAVEPVGSGESGEADEPTEAVAEEAAQDLSQDLSQEGVQA